MSKQKKWIGVVLLLLGFVVAAYSLRTAAHPGATITTNAMKTASPRDITQAPGVLPVTVIESYF
jgi:hypothetical protein